MAIVRYAGNRMTGVSSDTKPSSNLITGTTFHETNTDDLYIWDGDSWNIVAGDSVAQTLSNKTLTAPVLNGALSGTSFLDEDDLNSDSATAVASQQSIKAYVTAQVSGTTHAFKNLVVSGQDNIVADSYADTLTIVAGSGMVITNNASTDTITFTVSGITSVGALNSGSITSGFGAIDTGSSNITTTGTISAGTLVVTGTTTTVNSTTMTVVDPLIHLQTASGGGNLSSDTNKDVGIVMEYHNGSAAKEAFLGWDDSAGKLTFVPDASITSEVVSGSVGTIVANLEGNVTGNVTGSAGSATGNAATATALATARTIGGTSFDGTANIAVALSTEATNVTASANNSTDETVYPTFVDGATGTQGIETDTGFTYNPSSGVITATQFTGAVSGNATTATTLATARTIGGTSFDGSANIAVALAATATALATARTIGGVSFDGTANINLPGVNSAGNQDTTGTATNATHVTVADNESTNENNLITFIENASATGNVGLESDGDFHYNPSTGTVTATTFAGALTGNATTATTLATARTIGGTSFDGSANIAVALAATATTLATARTIGGTSFDGSANIVPATITVADTTDTSSYVALFESATGDLAPKTDAGITYNAGTGMLTATGFTGPLTGTASTATVATTVTTAVDTTDDSTAYVLLANAASGDQAVKTHAKITFDTQYGILNGINEIRVEDAGSDSYGDPSFCFAGDATTGIGRLSTGAMYMSVAAREICTMHYTSDFGRFMKFEQKTGGNHQSICFDSVINVDHKSNGISMEVTVGAAGLGFMDCAYVDTAGKFASADASATGTMPVVAFHPHGTKTEDEVTRVIIQGIIRDDTWNWTIGGRLYVSETTGDLTQTAPSDDGDFIQVVGIALTADSIYFNPSLTTIESAG